jgi:hypothetical protein
MQVESRSGTPVQAVEEKAEVASGVSLILRDAEQWISPAMRKDGGSPSRVAFAQTRLVSYGARDTL